MEVQVSSAAKKEMVEAGDVPCSTDFLIIGDDITEQDAIKSRAPIRIGLNGERIIWLDDLDPK